MRKHDETGASRNLIKPAAIPHHGHDAQHEKGGAAFPRFHRQKAQWHCLSSIRQSQCLPVFDGLSRTNNSRDQHRIHSVAVTMANSAVRSSRACTLCAFAVVLMSCTPVAMAVDWEPMPDGMQGEAEAAAEFAVKYMNFHSIFRGSGTLTTLLSASHLPTDGTGDVRIFLTMDVDVGGENTITMAEVYRRPGAVSYQVLLPGAIKNRKSSLPERMTSLTDRWLKVSTDDAFVKEGAHRIDNLLKDSQILLPVHNVAPVIKGILHAEARGRDIGIELSELARVKSTSTNTVQESKVAIVKLESRLIQKLQVKKLAYNDPGTDK